MSEFVVSGLTPDGRRVRARIAAATTDAAIEHLRSQGWCEVKLETQQSTDVPTITSSILRPENLPKMVDAAIVGEGIISGLISSTKWTASHKAIQFETTYNNPFDAILSKKQKVFSLSGVHAIETVHMISWMWEKSPITFVIFSPIFTILIVLAVLIGDKKSYLIRLRMFSGNSLWLDNDRFFIPDDAKAIVEAVQIALSQ